MRKVESMRLRCQECARPSDDAARGWRMYLGPDPDEPDAPPMLATYCRECAEREFGPVEHTVAGPPGFEPHAE